MWLSGHAMPSNADFQDFRDLYHDYSGRYTGEFQFIEAFTNLPVEWESTDEELEGFLDFLDMFDWADQERGHSQQYWDSLKETFFDYYGLTDQSIDWEALRSAYEAITG